jgi:ABC-2 type transport system ATP-binding protein
MIRIENLKKLFKTQTALDNVSLHVKPGELFAFLGPNGAGKTTTIRIMTGLTRRTSGTVTLNGMDVESDSVRAREQCGLVTQSINLDRELTVYENLSIHGRLFRMPGNDRERIMNDLLSYVEMADRKDSLVKNLSGGMKRRVMIARALMHSPSILFLDEPTVGLDPAIRRKIWALIKKIQNRGTTVFLTTHYIEEAEFLSDRVAFIDKGRIITVDTPQNLMSQLGEWAVDRIVDDDMKPSYFRSRTEAGQYAEDQNTGFTLRRVNLEDAFLTLTGKKVKGVL